MTRGISTRSWRGSRFGTGVSDPLVYRQPQGDFQSFFRVELGVQGSPENLGKIRRQRETESVVAAIGADIVLSPEPFEEMGKIRLREIRRLIAKMDRNLSTGLDGRDAEWCVQ